MKKPNRIARKGDSAPTQAQVKRRADAPVKSNRKPARIPSEAENARRAETSRLRTNLQRQLKAAGTVSLPLPILLFGARLEGFFQGVPEAAALSTLAAVRDRLLPAKERELKLSAAGRESLASKECPHGEHLCEVEHSQGVFQTLYQCGERFTIVDSVLSIRAGRVWRTWEEWSERNPGVAVYGLPKDRLRWQKFAASRDRGEVIAWLWENFDSTAIPAEFAEDFRPLRIVARPDAKQVRGSFCALAQLALKDRPHAEDRACASFDVMNIAAALGLKDEAAEAATVVNAYNVAFTAENSLRDMIDAGLK